MVSNGIYRRHAVCVKERATARHRLLPLDHQVEHILARARVPLSSGLEGVAIRLAQ
jgi:hypothetical protein